MDRRQLPRQLGYDMDAQSDLINIAIIVIYGVAIFLCWWPIWWFVVERAALSRNMGAPRNPATPSSSRIGRLLEQVGKLMTNEALLKIMKEQQRRQRSWRNYGHKLKVESANVQRWRKHAG